MDSFGGEWVSVIEQNRQKGYRCCGEGAKRVVNKFAHARACTQKLTGKRGNRDTTVAGRQLRFPAEAIARPYELQYRKTNLTHVENGASRHDQKQHR